MSEPAPISHVPRYVLWAVIILLLTPIVLMALFGNRADKEQVQALRTLASDTPLYPKFVQSKSTEFDKVNQASLVITYTVPAYSVTFDDVKSFYIRELTARGWQQQPFRRKPLIDLGGDREGHVTFSRGNYWITVEPNNRMTEYLVEYRWDGGL